MSATVSDANGRFVPDLQQDDFRVYEDDQPQTITHFSAERVPVSLGIVLDTSGSMAGEKIQSARTALDRFLFDLLDDDDEIFLYRFSDDPVLLQGWTNDRQLISRALGRITPNGATALYDAVAAAIPLAQSGSRPKKALLVISDGNDTSSRIDLRALRQRIRESEVLVYAVGIDGDSRRPVASHASPRRRALRCRRFPGRFHRSGAAAAGCRRFSGRASRSFPGRCAATTASMPPPCAT